MENDYNFLADLLTTYRANPDWLKFFWLFIPAALMTLCGHGLSRWICRVLGGGGGSRTGDVAVAFVATGRFGEIGLYRITSDGNGALFLEPVKGVPQITVQSEEDELR